MIKTSNMIKIAIIGRPNVGKSTIFNILSKNQKSIVYDFPGVTRDRLYASGYLGNFEYTLIDTPGIDRIIQKNLQDQVEYQAIMACTEADIIVFVVEEGELNSMDIEVANYIRKNSKPVLLIKNKADRQVSPENYYRLGFGEGIQFSAIHRTGFKEFKGILGFEILKCLFNNKLNSIDELELANNEVNLLENIASIKPSFEQKQLKLVQNLIEKINLLDGKKLNTNELPRICVVGKPNTGKSTYINTILEDGRLLTDNKAGTTRDAIEIRARFKDRDITLIDTAGMRKKNKIYENIENLSVKSSIEAIKLSDVAILMIDAQDLIQHQDLEIMDVISKSGKGLVIAINKCDLMTNKTYNIINSAIETNLFQMTNVPVIYCSNVKKLNLDKVIQEALNTYDRMTTKVATSKLNVWLKEATKNHLPPVIFKTKFRIKFKYITQVSCNPVVFKIFGNSDTGDIPKDYIKYLINDIGRNFKLFGISIKIKFIKNDNPYKNK